MNRPIFVLTLALAPALVVFPAPRAHGEKEPGIDQVFRDRCANCHTVPDLEVRTDLAWLDQVNRTS